ncbi:YbaB/EbfC family nucleoid-associated protein [Actinoplanes sp. HUAS TT8]|uniref:YbaB/EbfC family nucleoid-associated protein n=1 Tax=Actinoplanes sp. HUAS TT8 TaxID=3447453 RepID=UPI003F52391B
MGDFVSGEAADGRVWVELGTDGRLTDLYLDPRVAYLPLDELREALIAAFQQAQDRVRDQAADATTRYGATVAPERLRAALSEASDTAERRFAEVSTALYDLNRRAARPW